MALATAGTVNTCLEGEILYGIANKDTLRMVSSTWTATANIEIPIQKKGRAGVRLYTDGSTYRDTAIVIGDMLKVSAITAGTETHNQDSTGDDTAWGADDEPTNAEKLNMVGFAMEAVAADALSGSRGGTNKIDTLLSLKGGML